MQKSLLIKILAYLSRLMICKYNPVIIGITGSVGKTSTREAVFTVLKTKFRVRTAEKNYNNEIGLPLTILGIPHYGRNIFGWLGAFLKILAGREKNYPEVLVLEYGVDRPGDMDHLLFIARPNIVVVTAIGDIPVHVEFFQNPEELIAEKAKLVAALPPDGYVILNHDDYAVLDMASKIPPNPPLRKGGEVGFVATYGTEKHADVKIFNYQFLISKDEKLGDIPDGISFKIEHGDDVVPFYIQNAFGLPHAYSSAAAAAVGLVMNLNLVEISMALKNYNPPAGRLRLLKGIKNSFIIDDTYNAAPESMRAALDTLKSLPGKRKIAVLGDMLEIGKYSEQAHRAVGDQAAGFVDLLFCVGPRAKFIAEEYGSRRTVEVESRRGEIRPQNIVSSVHVFDDSVFAGKALDPLIREGDLILVKGSQSMRMEKTVLEIMAEPQKAGKLLVRQDKYWKS